MVEPQPSKLVMRVRSPPPASSHPSSLPPAARDRVPEPAVVRTAATGRPDGLEKSQALVGDLLHRILLVAAEPNQREVLADGECQVEIPGVHHALKALWQATRYVGRDVTQVAWPVARPVVGEAVEDVHPDRTPEECARPRLSAPIDKILKIRPSGHGSHGSLRSRASASAGAEGTCGSQLTGGSSASGALAPAVGDRSPDSRPTTIRLVSARASLCCSGSSTELSAARCSSAVNSSTSTVRSSFLAM